MNRGRSLDCEILVLGSGLAGLLCALQFEKSGRGLLATQGRLENGASEYAQGGIAAVTNEDDSFQSHIRDTLNAGAGLCAPRIVDLVVKEGPARVRELIEAGVRFTVRQNVGDEPETFDLGLEGGHS